MKKFKMVLALVMGMMLSFTSFAMAQEQNTVTKIDFIKMTLDLSKIDVPKKDDNKSYLESAFTNKVLTGDINSFSQEGSFTKEQAITILIRALGEDSTAKKMNDESAINNIKDKSSISPWAKPYIIYAAKNGIIDSNSDLNPKGVLTSDEAKNMTNKAKQLFDTVLTKEGLTAVKMLDASNAKMMNYKTYKLSGTMNMNGKTKTPEGETPINMVMNQEGFIQNPETIYVKTNAIVKDTENKEVKSSSEVYMKDRVMYIKDETNPKWIKMDLNPMMKEMESLMGKSFNSGGMSKEQLEAFGMYAKYDKDAVIDGKEYYVISMDIDKDSFRTVFKDIMNQVADASIEMAAESQGSNGEKVNKEEIKKGFEMVMENMDVEISYKMYVDKKDKIFDKMTITQNITMNMTPIISQMSMNGEFKYYDFDKEVKFPEIKESDIEVIE